MAELTRARPKVRSRPGGAAVPLDDLDKRLLNLLQGRFPIAPRPFAGVAEAAGVSEDRVRHLAEVAHRECYIANSLRTEVHVEPTVVVQQPAARP